MFCGNGFLGKYIVKELISRNFKVTVFDKHLGKNIKKISFNQRGYREQSKVITAIKGQDVVYH